MGAAYDTCRTDDKCILGVWCEYLKEETSLGRLRLRWEDNIKMDFKAKGRKIVNWIHLVEDRKKLSGSFKH